MPQRNARSVRSLLAAAAVFAGLPALSPAFAQVESTQAQPASTQMKHARKLAVDGKLVAARATLISLSADRAALGLSDGERADVVALLETVNTRLKSMDPVEKRVQSAEWSLQIGDLVNVDRHADDVMSNPQAKVAQAQKAQQLKSDAAAKRADIASRADTMLAQAEQDLAESRIGAARTSFDSLARSGAKFSPEQQARIDSGSVRIAAMIDPAMADAAMLQPGVVKKRQPGEPAPAQPAPEPQPEPLPQPEPAPSVVPQAEQPEQPAVQPASPQPVDNLIEEAKRANAQAMLAEADLAFQKNEFSGAADKYAMLVGSWRPYLSSEQITHAENRLAEARARMQDSGGDQVGQEIARGALIRQQALAEFDNALAESEKALAQGDPNRARDLAATAGVRIASARNSFNPTEYDSFVAKKNELLRKIDQQQAEQIAADNARRTTESAAAAAKQQTEFQQTRDEKIRQNILRVRDLQREMKYDEALQVLDNTLMLDPNNYAAQLLHEVIWDTKIFQEWNRLGAETLKDYARVGVYNRAALRAPDAMMDYPTDWPRVIHQRGEPTAFDDSPSNKRVATLLDTKQLPVQLNDNSIEDALKYVQTVTGVDMDIDWPALDSIGITKDKTVTLNLTLVQARTALDRILEKASDDAQPAAWAIKDGVLTISSDAILRKDTTVQIYDIRDMLIEVPDYDQAPQFDLNAVLQQTANPGQGGGAGGQSPFRDAQQQRQERRTTEESTQDLIDILQTHVDPNGWRDNGGETGLIQQLSGNLIISNTARNHVQIGGLLRKLRAQRSMQINVETRFLLISQDFFEQIGFDLDVYFNANNNQVRAARATNPNVRPSDFFDPLTGNPRRVIPDPTEGNADTGDASLDANVVPPDPTSVIGVTQNSLGLTSFLGSSGFAQQVLGRAPALGIAGTFLDDIQVDFLVAATQADRRGVTLTAPRLTFTNGQTSNIFVATQIAFVADLEPVVSESAVGFDPTLGVVSEGVRLVVEGTVSSDRRYVTLNVDAAVSKVRRPFRQISVSAVAGGQLVNSSDTESFIEAPETTVTRVQTTVTVPDQGTILLGGQRLVSESEVETGVPILSKLPILNRFFSNNLISKEEQTLLIMLKPTVIIQSEEEEKNFPGLFNSNMLGG